MRHFSLIYTLTGSGWARAEVTNGVASVTLDISYIGAGIEAASEAAIALLGAADRAQFEWVDEPRWSGKGSGSSEWRFEKRQEQLRIVILGGSDISIRPSQRHEHELLTIDTTPQKFAIQVWDALRHLLEEHGAEGYAQSWHRPFPLRDYQRLDALIREAKRSIRAARRERHIT